MRQDRSNAGHNGRGGPDPLSSSFRSGSPLADQLLASDMAALPENENAVDTDVDDGELEPSLSHGHPMYRRASGVAYGGMRPIMNDELAADDMPIMTAADRKRSRDAERSLLRDNHLLPPKHQEEASSQNVFGRIYRRLFSTKIPQKDSTESDPAIVVRQATETSPLLGEQPDGGASGGEDSDVDVEEQWEQALASRNLRTTWQRETKTIATYSAPLIATFFLQYSINAASIFAVGHISKTALGAVSLANMSSAITCIAPFQGLATSLDTLCAQAYGSGNKQLVGLQFQRMTCFLFMLSAPVVILWLSAESVLRAIIPDPESARLAGLYLRIMIFSIPGVILFETGKRFTQAQGLFNATTYVLIIVAPLNIFINWLLVWHLGYGFIGAPIAVAITENMLPLLLFLYVYFIDGKQCWGGFTRRAFSNWWPMIRLALPGMVMVEAEWLAFEIMTLVASRLGTEYLAAQSVLTTLASISYQIPFPMSIAASTRIANLIGAGLVEPAKIAARVTFVLMAIIGLVMLTLYTVLRFQLPLLFTEDPDVVKIVAKTLPLVAVMQIFDCISAGAHGLLRGIGKQSIGGPANLIAYYAISLPLSMGMTFGLHWGLEGMWIGITIGLFVVSVIEYTYLYMTDWNKAAEEAEARNEAT